MTSLVNLDGWRPFVPSNKVYRELLAKTKADELSQAAWIIFINRVRSENLERCKPGRRPWHETCLLHHIEAGLEKTLELFKSSRSTDDLQQDLACLNQTMSDRQFLTSLAPLSPDPTEYAAIFSLHHARPGENIFEALLKKHIQIQGIRALQMVQRCNSILALLRATTGNLTLPQILHVIYYDPDYHALLSEIGQFCQGEDDFHADPDYIVWGVDQCSQDCKHTPTIQATYSQHWVDFARRIHSDNR